jgi:hypothetical protein
MSVEFDSVKNNFKKLLLGISLIFILSLVFVVPISSSPILSNSITIVSKPSAASDLPYKDYEMTWKNQCPLCHHNNTLTFNPKKTYEGELTCSYCDADYCGVTGRDKHGEGSRAELTPFKKINSKYNI